MGVRDAMFHAASQRMRPMLMTALSACIGLLPAAVSTGIGSQVQRPLATVVVGGMFIGPIVLLIVVPALQTLVLEREIAKVPSAMRARRSRPSEQSMTKERPMRIGFYLRAGVLFGATAILASSAAHARPHHHGLHAAHLVRPDISAPPANHVAPTGTLKPEGHGVADTDDALTKAGRNAGPPGQPGLAKTASDRDPRRD